MAAMIPTGTWSNRQPRRQSRELSPAGAEIALAGHLIHRPELAADLSPDIWGNLECQHIHHATRALSGQLEALALEQRLRSITRWLWGRQGTGWKPAANHLTRFTAAAGAAPDVDRLIPMVVTAARRRALAVVADRLHTSTGDPVEAARDAVAALEQLLDSWKAVE